MLLFEITVRCKCQQAKQQADDPAVMVENVNYPAQCDAAADKIQNSFAEFRYVLKMIVHHQNPNSAPIIGLSCSISTPENAGGNPNATSSPFSIGMSSN